jgi:hypothetical protein
MALTSITLRFNSNANVPTPSPGDVIHAIYDVFVDTAGGNAYPAGGEPISFAAQFFEVHSVAGDPAIAAPVLGAADAVGAMIPKFQRDAGAAGFNAGFVRFYQGAVGNLTELAVAPYPNVLNFTLLVHGRPITDAA